MTILSLYVFAFLYARTMPAEYMKRLLIKVIIVPAVGLVLVDDAATKAAAAIRTLCAVMEEAEVREFAAIVSDFDTP